MLRTALTLSLLLCSAAAQATIEDFKFEVKGLGGRHLEQSHFADNVLIVDFWGTWCPPCAKAVPGLVQLHKKYKHLGLEIVGLNYREGEGAEAIEKVRKFALENGITYELAMGTEAISAQVPEFGTFPTMLFFERGLKHTKTKVGFSEGDEAEIEAWVRKALALEEIAEPTPEEIAQREAEAEAEKDREEKVADGAIFKPGIHDSGFEHTFEGLAGEEITFAEMLDKPVLLAITSTWVPDAEATAKTLEALRQELGEKVRVVSGFYERSKDPAERRKAIQDFLAPHSFTFDSVCADLKLIRKVHKLQALPTFLLFDAQGKLVHRAEGLSEPITAALRTAAVGLK